MASSSLVSDSGEALPARERSLTRACARSTTALSENWPLLLNRPGPLMRRAYLCLTNGSLGLIVRTSKSPIRFIFHHKVTRQSKGRDFVGSTRQKYHMWRWRSIKGRCRHEKAPRMSQTLKLSVRLEGTEIAEMEETGSSVAERQVQPRVLIDRAAVSGG